MKKQTIIRISIAVVVILVIALVIAKKQGKIGKEEGLKISTELAEKRSIIETVAANGKIQPEVEVKISPDVSGEVVELYIKEGDQVKQGQLLAKINPDIYASNLDQMIASLNSQRANLSMARSGLSQVEAQFINAENSFKRNKQLSGQGVISQSEFDAAKANFEVAKNEVESAKQRVKAAQYTVRSSEAMVKQARDNLTKTSLFAPMEGTVTRLAVEKGERVVGTSQFAGTEIMRIANLDVMEVSVEVSENDIVRVNLLDTAIVEVDAFMDIEFKGLVTEIANSADISAISSDQVTNFDVKIRILPESYSSLMDSLGIKESPFRPGMSANVDVQTEKVSNIITVPIQAVTTRVVKDSLEQKTAKPKAENEETEEVTVEQDDNKEFQEVVFVYSDGKAVKKIVKTGIQDSKFIEIKSGIEEGAEVISAPYRAISKKLEDGKKVKKVDKKELYKKE